MVAMFDGIEDLTMDGKIGRCLYSSTDVEIALTMQHGLKMVPFSGMDKSGKSVCDLHVRGKCPYGEFCSLRHIIGDKQVVCKHWLRGLCKKSDQCEFLHEYDLNKMPECFFFSKYGMCSNKECLFRHIDPDLKIKECLWYSRGFCRHGPYCKNRHRRRVMCPEYLAGFCTKGKECKFAHPLFSIPVNESRSTSGSRLSNTITCHNCHERGHKAGNCPHLPMSSTPVLRREPPTRARNFVSNTVENEKRNISDVTCYKCGEKGHYANRCNKGFLAFLSDKSGLIPISV